jgi:hypothetical protein
MNLKEQKSNVLRNLYLFFFHKLTTQAFEAWLQADSWAQTFLGADAFLEFMRLDFERDAIQLRELARLTFTTLCQVDIRSVRALEICTLSLSGSVQLDVACAELARLSLDGCSVVSPVFVGYHDELVRSKGEFLPFYRNRIEADMSRLQMEIQKQLKCSLVSEDWFSLE